MCRLGVFPPGFPADSAEQIMRNMCNFQRDGSGSVYIRDDKFVVNKSALHLPMAIASGVRLFDHMPCDSWTVAHLRARSVGSISQENAHPFISGEWALAHNGNWDPVDIVRPIAEGCGAKFVGDTDSEVACWALSKLGPRKFLDTLNWDGVFAALSITGEVSIVKDGFDLYISDTEWGPMFTTEDVMRSGTRVDDGLIRIDKYLELKELVEVERFGNFKRNEKHESYGSLPQADTLPTCMGRRNNEPPKSTSLEKVNTEAHLIIPGFTLNKRTGIYEPDEIQTPQSHHDVSDDNWNKEQYNNEKKLSLLDGFEDLDYD